MDRLFKTTLSTVAGVSKLKGELEKLNHAAVRSHPSSSRQDLRFILSAKNRHNAAAGALVVLSVVVCRLAEHIIYWVEESVEY